MKEGENERLDVADRGVLSHQRPCHGVTLSSPSGRVRFWCWDHKRKGIFDCCSLHLPTAGHDMIKFSSFPQPASYNADGSYSSARKDIVDDDDMDVDDPRMTAAGLGTALLSPGSESAKSTRKLK